MARLARTRAALTQAEVRGQRISNVASAASTVLAAGVALIVGVNAFFEALSPTPPPVADTSSDTTESS